MNGIDWGGVAVVIAGGLFVCALVYGVWTVWDNEREIAKIERALCLALRETEKEDQ